ncbi:hypothetical protein [Antarctobacter heliothermus]|uniref:Uncharacterized protein n=1 Tax=Antarctobacter heliothermus TaxID=74033 RepID=A0A239CE30_9RHOB|nr:hypothetical protein [Antarctobacter heliothermus]SNS18340.1 hypothetical protein SAMN04488078_100693 [Antarctobacter heliothermus]
MKKILSLCLATLIVGSPALAWDRSKQGNYVTWTFQGDEIVSYSVTEPSYNEDPAVLNVSLWSSHSGSVVVLIEADLGVGNCLSTLSHAAGNASIGVTLVANLNATTLNGVTLDQCSTY